MVAERRVGKFQRRSRDSRMTTGAYLARRTPMSFRATSIALALLAVAARNVLGGSDAVIPPRVIISVHDQKLMVLANGQKLAVYPVSTSKFGIGDRWGSMSTPLGWLQVAQKIGDHAVPGQVIRNRRYTGEVLPPNAPGRDPIVSRIIWLRGLEKSNANAFNRCIYIHGTPEEKLIGKPASYGCVRMRTSDVIAIYNQIELGALVEIIPDALPKIAPAKPNTDQGILASGSKSAPETRKKVSALASPQLRHGA